MKLEVRMMPWSRISGRVVDGRGHAVEKAQLELTGRGMVANGHTYLRTSWGGGGGANLSASPLPMTFLGQTDAEGSFDVQLMPGTYGLSVVPPPDLKAPDREADGPLLAWKRTYYPGVALPESASPIVVLAGGEVSDVELKLLAVPTHAVRGVVLNTDGTPAPKVTVALGENFRSTSVESKPDGTFEFPAVAEGEWGCIAEVQRGRVKLRASEWIEVARHDLENVKLRLVTPLTVRGKLLVEVENGAPKDAPPLRPSPMILSLRQGRTRRSDDPRLGGAPMVNLDAQGEFIVQNVYPGVYGLSPILQSPPPPYYLDAVRAGGADLTVQDTEISSDVAITVVYKTDSGSVLGKAENCASGGVVLVPVDPARRQGAFSRSGACDSSGHYEVRAVRPGDYYAIALAGNGPALPLDEARLSEAVRVTVRSGEASVADVKAITKPVY